MASGNERRNDFVSDLHDPSPSSGVLAVPGDGTCEAADALGVLRAEQEALRRHAVIQPVCTTCLRLVDLHAQITTLETGRQEMP